MVETRLNPDGQPINLGFNYRRNKNKVAYALRGILDGIIADSKLNEAELLFLYSWMQSQKYLVPDASLKILFDIIGVILDDGYISSQEFEDLYGVISNVIANDHHYSYEIEDGINELLGFILGISADGILTDSEVENLGRWLKKNNHISKEWPANIIIERIELIKNNGNASEDEKKDLIEALKRITGQRFDEYGDADGAVAEVFSHEVSRFEHKNKKICFTGKFTFGTRNVCEGIAVSMGAKISKKVTKDLNVLVLGTFPSRDWRFTSHGRKIEKALCYIKAGKDILILSESKWIKFIH